MYVTPVSLMRDGTEGCPQQLLPIFEWDLEGGGGEAEVSHRHHVEEANTVLLREEGDAPVDGYPKTFELRSR